MEHKLLGRVAALARQVGQRGVPAGRSRPGNPSPAVSTQVRRRLPSDRWPSAAMASSTPGTSTVSVVSTSAAGIQVVRSSRQVPSDQLPVRSHAVAGRVLGRVGVMQIRHAFIGIVPGHPAWVGPRDKRNPAPHLQLGLKGERLVAGTRSPTGVRSFTRNSDTERVPDGIRPANVACRSLDGRPRGGSALPRARHGLLATDRPLPEASPGPLLHGAYVATTATPYLRP